MSVQIPGVETKSSGLSIFLSFFWPGLGHLYLGRVGRGVVMLVGTLVLYWSTWIVISAAKGGSDLHQNLLNLAVSESHERGVPSQVAFDKEWKDLEDLRAENIRLGLFGLGLAAASFAWWIWSMVSARKVCDLHNRRVFEQARTRDLVQGVNDGPL